MQICKTVLACSSFLTLRTRLAHFYVLMYSKFLTACLSTADF